LDNALEQHQGGSGVSIYRLLTHFQCKVLNIDKDQQSAFINCNTPQEWQKLTDICN